MSPADQLDDIRFMRLCLRLAERGRGYVSPNPVVGALLVKNGRVLARGYHKKFGGNHAEVECLSRYDGDCHGTTLYVNLEPCSHFGKTPPCTEMIIRRGVSRVIVGMIDPNPIVSGNGVRELKTAGIAVVTGICKNECREANKMFIKNISSHKPYVNVKIAQTLDGKVAKERRRLSWITGAASQKEVHKWRRAYDAVCIGAGTIRSDNPLLTVRHVSGRDPSVVVLDGGLNVSARSRFLSTASRQASIIVCTENAARENESRVARLTRSGAFVLQMRGDRISLDRMLSALFQHGIGSLLVEGGQEIFSQFVMEDLYDELNVFISSKLYGRGLSPCVLDLPIQDRLSHSAITTRRLGNDVLIQLTR